MITATPAQMRRMAEVSAGYSPKLEHAIIQGGDDLYLAIHSLTYVISPDGATKVMATDGRVMRRMPAYTPEELLT